MVMNDELLLVQLLDGTAAPSYTNALLTIADKIRKSESFVEDSIHFIIYRLTQMCVIKTRHIMRLFSLKKNV